MLENLTFDDIRAACGGASFHRGLDYFREGMVREIRTQVVDRALKVEAAVTGSFQDAYRLKIRIEREGQDFRVEGDCTCPVGFNCKHVAATLIDLVENGAGIPLQAQSDDVLEWLELFHEEEGDNDTLVQRNKADTTSYRLVYLLEPQPQEKGVSLLAVSTHRAKRLATGSYGKPAAYALEKLNTAEFFIQQADRDIGRLLVTPKQYYHTGYSNTYLLSGELGQLALKKILETGQCYWVAIGDEPLALGESRQIRFHWRDVKGGKTLACDIGGPETSLCKLEGYWYIDVAAARVGQAISSTLSPRQLEAALRAPVVPEGRLEEVSRHLKVDLPGDIIPAPVELEFRESELIEKPQPMIKLSSRKTANIYGKQHMQHRVDLRFRYGPVEVDGLVDEAVTAHLIGNHLYKVTRDAVAEQTALMTLFERGLVQRGDNKLRNRIPELVFPEEADPSQVIWMWDEFLERDVPELEAQGWEVEQDESFALQIDEVDDWDARLEDEGNQWFSLALGVKIDGREINLLPLLVEILSQVGNTAELYRRLDTEQWFLLSVAADRWFKVPSERLKPIFDTLVELYSQNPLRADGKLVLSPYQGIQLGELLNDTRLKWHGADELQQLYSKLKNFNGIEQAPPTDGFKAELRGYQQEGLNWMQFLREFRFNGILADDMGLGKTVQTLANLLLEKKSGRMTKPCLIIAPTSLMGNWRRETNHFAPELSVLTLHGDARRLKFSDIPDYDIVLTTYPLLRRDHDVLLKQKFHYVVLDEAQAIKNPKSQTAQTVFRLQCEHRLCLSGTPLENHLGELWSIFHFLMPGFLGPLKQFNQLFRYPIERQMDAIRQDQLHKRLKPFMLRRTKSEVVKELPEKNEIVRTVVLEDKQRDLYESIRLAMDSKVRAEISSKGLARSQIMILDALLKLRQVCCDPRLVSLPRARDVQQSAKLELLMDMLPNMIEEGRKILIFSQFTQMLAIIEEGLTELGIEFSKLTGQTRKRDEAINRFQGGEVPVFLISLKAGGVGLNLTAADTVIHYDPWWNPAAENQATDRAHRIGQDKTVFVYKLVTENTVEERIIAMQERKQSLADAVYSGTDKQVSSFSADELVQLLSE